LSKPETDFKLSENTVKRGVSPAVAIIQIVAINQALAKRLRHLPANNRSLLYVQCAKGIASPLRSFGALDADFGWRESVPNNKGEAMANKIIRVITCASNGAMRTREFESLEQLFELHEQTGVDDCSTDLTLRGLPLLRGLVGPMPDGKKTAVYESPDVFETLTKEWAIAKPKRRRSAAASETATETETEKPTAKKTNMTTTKKPVFLAMPNAGASIEAAIINR
jgi:hypothetical protein